MQDFFSDNLISNNSNYTRKRNSRKVPEGPARGVDARVPLPVDVASADRHNYYNYIFFTY